MGQHEFALPAAKRQKLSALNHESQPVGSRLFAPFRSVGLVSPTSVPFTSIPLGKTTFQITTSIGRSIQTYDLRRGLQLVFLSQPQCPETITATYAYRDRTFVAWGGSNGKQGGIWVFKRGNLLGELETSSTAQSIDQITVFGNWIVGCGAKAIEVWKSGTYEHYTTITPTPGSVRSRDSPFTGKIAILPSYLNKVFVARRDGNVEIYNISTAKLVHTIAAPSPNSGPVTAIQPASAICILSVAYADGTLCLLDVDTDEVIMSLRSKNGKAITSISFRTDGLGAGPDGRKDGVMATASLEDGDVTFWDLNRGGKVAGVLRNAHEISSSSKTNGITRIEFLAGQNVLVSSGLDNALHSWIFDQNPFSSIPRSLHARSGHGAPVTELMFLPAASDGSEASGKWLLSAGHDRSLWGFSLRKDAQNTELSQGNVKQKAKKVGQMSVDRSAVEDFKAAPIVDVACCLNRDGGMGAVSGRVWANDRNVTAEESSMTGWESIVTAHADDQFARTWSWGKKKAGRWTFESGDHKPVTSVAMTACGTFALVGSSGGAIDMFNLQSGTHRKRFSPPQFKATKARELKGQIEEIPDLLDTLRGHRSAITGIVVDNLNQTVVSSSLDGTIIFWDFASGGIVKRLKLPSTAALSMKYNSVSNLLALSCDDLCIRVIDIESHRVVRDLWGCVGQVNDLCFSHDGRWIVTCSMDSVVRIFDLATGHLIDAFRTFTCTNVAFSSTGEYLATTHAGALGINIWTNKSLYTQIAARQISEDTGIVDFTDTSVFEPTSQLAMTETVADEDEVIESVGLHTTIDQLDDSLLTLSLVPRSRWQTLLNLENIRQRNKPIQPPEKPKAAPFFLGSSLAISNSTLQPEVGKQPDSRLSNVLTVNASVTDRAAEKQVSVILQSIQPSLEDAQKVIKHLISLPPSATDLFIRSIGLSELLAFIHILTAHLRLHRDYELINTWMAVVLKIHADYVSEVDEVRNAAADFRKVNEGESKRLDSSLGMVTGVVGGWLRSSR